MESNHTGPIVHASRLRKTYRGAGDVEALRGVDFEVARGEMVAVVGPSGSGKTTLLNCLSGLDHFDSGSVRIDGTDLAEMSDRERTAYRRKNMGFVFQAFNLLPVLSAAGNIKLPLDIAGRKPDPDWLAAVVAAAALTGRLAHRRAATRCATRAAPSPLRKKAQCVPVSSSLPVWLRPRYSRSPC